MAVIETFSSQFPLRRPRFIAAVLALSVIVSATRFAAAAVADSRNDELSALQRAALRQAHLDEYSRKTLEARLRLSALLPHLRVNVGRGWQWDYSSSSASTSSTPDVNDHLSYGVAAQWDLSRLLFQREEILLRRDAQRLSSFRTQLLLRVARLYGQRCKAVNERSAANDQATQQRIAARILALDISLAALTGDEHIGRKLHRCADTATAALANEIDALEPSGDEMPRQPPSENLAEEQALAPDEPAPSEQN